MISPCASARITSRFLPTEMPLWRSPSSMPSAQRSVLTPGAIETMAALKLRLVAGSECESAGAAEAPLRCARSENSRMAEKNAIRASPRASFLQTAQRPVATSERIRLVQNSLSDAHETADLEE